METKNINFSQLYDDFNKEKAELESTLATLELLTDKNALDKIQKGVKELKTGQSKKYTFDDIDKL